MLNVVEAFSGIGSQREALSNLGIPFRVSATIEWEIGAIYAYDIIHHGPQDLHQYRHLRKDDVLEILSQYNLSTSGKESAGFSALSGMSLTQLKAILCAIERSHNLVDITNVHAEDLENDIDVLTYSFPCQDLSVSSFWWNNTSGIDRDSGNRSSLLWEIERILFEFRDQQRKLPKFLLMENVSAILNQHHIKNFDMWRSELVELGYINRTYTLKATNFGVPQGRERTYMLSVFVGDDKERAQRVHQYFKNNNLEERTLSIDEIKSIGEYLRLDYSNESYRREAIEATPNFTPSREKIFYNNLKLAIDDEPQNCIAKTITTKQDRHPNSGIIVYSDDKQLVKGSKYRNITSREAFLLMGFQEAEYDRVMEANFSVAENRMMLSPSKMLKLAGNSIVVDVLEAIFTQVDEINNEILCVKKEKEDLLI